MAAFENMKKRYDPRQPLSDCPIPTNLQAIAAANLHLSVGRPALPYGKPSDRAIAQLRRFLVHPFGTRALPLWAPGLNASPRRGMR